MSILLLFSATVAPRKLIGRINWKNSWYALHPGHPQLNSVHTVVPRAPQAANSTEIPVLKNWIFLIPCLNLKSQFLVSFLEKTWHSCWASCWWAIPMMPKSCNIKLQSIFTILKLHFHSWSQNNSPNVNSPTHPVGSLLFQNHRSDNHTSLRQNTKFSMSWEVVCTLKNLAPIVTLVPKCLNFSFRKYPNFKQLVITSKKSLLPKKKLRSPNVDQRRMVIYEVFHLGMKMKREMFTQFFPKSRCQKKTLNKFGSKFQSHG